MKGINLPSCFVISTSIFPWQFGRNFGMEYFWQDAMLVQRSSGGSASRELVDL